MAKVPDGGKVEEFDGKGNVWFKIFQDEPSIVDERIRWPNFGIHSLLMSSSWILC